MTLSIVSKSFSIPSELYSDLDAISIALGFTPSAVLTELLSGSISPLAAYLRGSQCTFPSTPIGTPLRRYVGSNQQDLHRSFLLLQNHAHWTKGAAREIQLDLL